MTREDLAEGIASAVVKAAAVLPGKCKLLDALQRDHPFNEDLGRNVIAALDEAEAGHCAFSDEELASWAQTLAVYLYEFVVRFHQRGLARERAEELARQATVRKMRERKVHRLVELLTVELENLDGGKVE